MIDLKMNHVKCKIIKILEDSMGENRDDFIFRDYFLGIIPKV